jgi:hypothetical protein
VQVAGKTDVLGARQAAHDVDAIASPFSCSHNGYRDASTAEEDRPKDDPPPLSMTRMEILGRESVTSVKETMVLNQICSADFP